MNEKDIALFFSAAALAVQNNDEKRIKRTTAILIGKPDPFPDDDQTYYTVEALAKMVDCSKRTITNLIDAGEIKSFKIGVKRMTTKRDWDAYILKNKYPPAIKQ